MRLLIAGWQGQLAQCLVSAALRRDDVEACAVGRPARDLCEPPTIHRNLSDGRPDVVINAAAYTHVDRAEAEPDAAMALNRDGAGLLARAAADQQVPIIHISTDYVYSGEKSGPYVEDDATEPKTVYGASKLAGEQVVAEANANHAILRTSWMFSADGQNFVRSMLARAEGGDPIRVVNDQLGCPTYAPHLAHAVLEVASRLVEDRGGDNPALRGVFHVAGAGATSWFDFATAIFAASKARGGPFADVTPISSRDYPTTASRPANSVLACDKLKSVYSLTLPPWQDGLHACLDQLLPASEERTA